MSIKIVGRQNEVERMYEVLNKIYSPYVSLVGPNGIGKKSIIMKYEETFNVEAIQIEGNSLMALTKMGNSIFDMMQRVIKEVSKEQRVLVITNGQAITDTTLLDLLNETTVPTVFISTVENAPKNYEILKIDTLPIEELEVIAENAIEELEEHYGVDYSAVKNEGINKAVRVKGKYGQPVDTLRFLEELALKASPSEIVERVFKSNFKSDFARTFEDNDGSNAVTIEHISQLTTDTNSMTEVKGIFGQEEAIRKIEDHLKKKQLGFYEDKPLSLFFAGPTGVGKTETAKKIAEMCDMELLRIDMTTMVGEHSVTRLVGSPPGYVGYQDGGIIPNKLKRNNKLVILFDEVEKAHPRIMDSVLIPMGEGVFQDSKGEDYDCKDCIIIFTSNIGAIEDKSLGFGKVERSQSVRTVEAIKRAFRPEFIGRVDEVCVFNPLEEDAIRKVATREIAVLEEKSGIKVAEEILNEILQSVNKEYGAREVKKMTRDLAGTYIIREMSM